ncbi:MAG: T9SS type A sorting domain-containing protein [Rubricoccaceae bacterium]
MRIATRLLLAAAAFVLWAGPAVAQNDVTFQVDMNAYITSCQFNPATNTVRVPGSMNGWETGAFQLADGNEDGIYTGTFSLPEGEIEFKYYVGGGGPITWENDPNRTYTVVAGAQTLPVVPFNGPAVENVCSAQQRNYEVVFTVDMRVQASRGAFDPNTQDVKVAGNFTDWGTNPVRLDPDPFITGVYTGLVNIDDFLSPGTLQYKYIVTSQSDGAIVAWENDAPGGGNYTLQLTGNEPDSDGDGRLEAFAEERFWGLIDFSQVLEEPATVTYIVDLRPAYYYRADVGPLPGAGGPVSDITGLFINGPAMWESVPGGGPSGGITDWQGWGPGGLGSDTRFAFTAGNDSLWTLTLEYPAGALRALTGKLGVNGADNEGGFGNNHTFRINPGANTIAFPFGAIRQSNGTFDTRRGPDANGDGNPDPIYAPYIVVDNTVTPATASVVRRGGFYVSVEGLPQMAEGVTLGRPYPNPAVGLARLDLELAEATDVRVTVVDLMGRTVATLAEGLRPAGTTTLEMNTAGLAAGVYVLRVEAGGAVATRRMTVVR